MIKHLLRAFWTASKTTEASYEFIGEVIFKINLVSDVKTVSARNLSRTARAAFITYKEHLKKIKEY